MNETHDFYCTNCGMKGIPIARKASNKKEKFHRKALWCIYCQQIVNHIECRNGIEVKEFKQKYLEGDFKNEAKDSLAFGGGSRIR